MKETSAKQYNNRLENMVKKGVYNQETKVTPETSEKISCNYADKAGEYERTIKYYLEFKNYTSNS